MRKAKNLKTVAELGNKDKRTLIECEQLIETIKKYENLFETVIIGVMQLSKTNNAGNMCEVFSQNGLRVTINTRHHTQQLYISTANPLELKGIIDSQL